MQIKKKNIKKILYLFLLTHIFIWTFVPSISNTNLPLDTIEALAWGNDLQLGYGKHPPLSAWFPEIFYQIFGNQDWAYYFLSQIFVALSFFVVFKFSEDFFQNSIHSLISVLLLEGIYFYNFTSTEFNVNVCQLPFWALTVFYFWQAFKKDDNSNWLLFGVFAALGILSKYLFLYLLVSILIFLIYIFIKNKQFNFKYILAGAVFLIMLIPHLIWLADHNYSTIHYAIFRSVDDPLSGFEGSKFLDHLLYPIIFLGKQAGILLPFFVMLFFVVSKFKTKINYKDKKILFLISISILPIVLVFLTSLITGARIRTMGMTPFYLFIGVFFVYIFQAKIKTVKFTNFFSIFLILFIASPLAYFTVAFTEKNERTDYPGKKISQLVQTQWENNFSNEIDIVVGYGWINGWYAQNLSYHLKTRPKWKTKIENESKIGTIWIQGFNKMNNCTGVLFQIKPLNDICMFGKK